MRRRIPQSFVDLLLSSVDITNVIGSRISLTQNSQRSSVDCPFHDDNEKSLVVDSIEQTYSCAVCDVTGSAIGFVMHFDNIHFVDALKDLASTVNIDTSEYLSDEILERPAAELHEILNEVTEFYNALLLDSPRALNYLNNRGISSDIIKKHRIGFAPFDRNHLTAKFPSGLTKLSRAGLCGKNNDGSFFPRFRDRIIFPVHDFENNVIGFGARSLGNGLPKYLNSPSSIHFNKSKVLYGVSNYSIPSVDQISLRFDAIVVEGYIDVVASHQHGLTNTIATLGTSLTEHHIKKLKERFRRICFCFDGDVAGLAAGKKAFNLVLPHLSEEFRASFCILPEGEDPDSILNRAGITAFISCIEESLDESSFMIQSHLIKNEISGIGPISALCAILKPQIETISHPGLKTECIEALSDFSGICLKDYIQ